MWVTLLENIFQTNGSVDQPMHLEELLWLLHWLIYEIGRIDCICLQSRHRHSNHYFKVAITICTASFPSSSLFICLIKSLNLAGFIQYFVVIFSKFKFQSLLIGEVPTIICTAQLHPKSVLCFISVIQYLNFAGLLQYFAVISSTLQLLLIINAPTWSPSPSNAHSLSALHCLPWQRRGLCSWRAGHWSWWRRVRRSCPPHLNSQESQCQHPVVHWQARVLTSSLSSRCCVIWFNVWAGAWIASKQNGWAARRARNRIRNQK